MNKKKVLINQPGFWGDVIFVMAIAQYYQSLNYEVYFPLFDHYLDEFPNIKNNFKGINILKISEFPEYDYYNHHRTSFEDENFLYLALRYSGEKYSEKHMHQKYVEIKLDCNLWRSIKIERNYEKENELFNILKISKDDKYNFINTFYSQEYYNGNFEFKLSNDYKCVFLKKIEGFSVFDWIGIMENASTIHTIHTSIQYLIEVFDTMPDEIHIYERKAHNQSHSRYDYLFNKKYIYH